MHRPPAGALSNSPVVWEVPHSAATWSEYALASERVALPPREDVATDVTSTLGCAVMTGAGAVIITLPVRSHQLAAMFGAGGVVVCQGKQRDVAMNTRRDTPNEFSLRAATHDKERRI